MSKICSLGFCKRTSRFLVTVGVGIGLGLIIANVNRDNDQVYRNSESPFVSNAVIEEVKTTDHGQIEKTNLEVYSESIESFFNNDTTQVNIFELFDDNYTKYKNINKPENIV